MRYISTRGQAPAVSFLDAILGGLAPDGGLYVPEAWPMALDTQTFRRDAALNSFAAVARDVLIALAGSALPEDAANDIAQQAYGASSPWPPAVAPLVQVGPADWILELTHGPSLSFKDVAMQLIGPLYDYALSQRGERLSVVCATSGDTGGAAVEALKGRDRVDLFVLTPRGRVSDVQRRFMTSSGASNVHTIEIEDDFDACQAIVKTMFADRTFTERASLSGVNSINWARIAAQSVYFHIAANALCAPSPVSFVVPTGNFGDAYSGWVAKQMGAPIASTVIATNANDILRRALRTGRYERGPQSHATLSPAMDIQVASNFERVLFEALERDADRLRGLYTQFAQSGGFDIPEPALKEIWRDFPDAVSANDEETVQSMQADWDGGRGYLACPHTAVGRHARHKAARLLGAGPVVALATAHPAKFPETVEQVTGAHPHLPTCSADLFQRTERLDALPADIDAVKRYISERSRAWR